MGKKCSQLSENNNNNNSFFLDHSMDNIIPDGLQFTNESPRAVNFLGRTPNCPTPGVNLFQYPTLDLNKKGSSGSKKSGNEFEKIVNSIKTEIKNNHESKK